jgi:hypothetical protein
VVFCPLDTVAGEAAANADERASVNTDDAAAGFGKAQQLWHVTTHTSDARHFSQSATVQPNREMICHLRRA